MTMPAMLTFVLNYLLCILTFICSGSQSDGHLGCSSGYDGLAYKPHLHSHYNSEGREQVQSLLGKVASSF